MIAGKVKVAGIAKSASTADAVRLVEIAKVVKAHGGRVDHKDREGHEVTKSSSTPETARIAELAKVVKVTGREDHKDRGGRKGRGSWFVCEGCEGHGT